MPVRLLPVTATHAYKLAHVVQSMYPDGSQRVDLRETLTMTFLPAQGKYLMEAMQPWLKVMYGAPSSVLMWTIQGKVTASVFYEALMRFGHYVTATVMQASILRRAADVLRTHGWVQNYSGNPESGFDVLAAIAVADGGQNVQIRLSIIEELRSKLPVPVAEWNDEPGRTVGDVLSLLESTAASLETLQ